MQRIRTNLRADLWLYRLSGAGDADRAGTCRVHDGTGGQYSSCHEQKKQYVIDAERQNFVYGNEEQGIKGCIANGISEQAPNKIYDSMVDFAKYAFNKSHALAYAVVSYQTAYFKYYYPVEFMAALMTSVIDNTRKVSEYIFTCRQMGIKVLPPDVNEGRRLYRSWR